MRDRLPANVDGDFYVDSSCIDCDTCRWMAPETFDRFDEQSRVHNQPADDAARWRALKALLACPTSSIHTAERHGLKPVVSNFPEPIDENVHHCGFHSEKSYGASSYLIIRPEGNVLIDSPRFARPLVKRLDELGGVDLMFLTHKDDVADHQRFRDHFGCRRALHFADLQEETRDVEIVLEGDDPTALDDELLAIPTPGHTQGSTCLLYRDRYLFTGDHLAANPLTRNLYAFRKLCWYDWPTQCRTVARLEQHDFEWVLPGHGRRLHRDADAMKQEIRDCVRWMET